MTKIDGWYNDDPPMGGFPESPESLEFEIVALDEPSMEDYPASWDDQPADWDGAPPLDEEMLDEFPVEGLS